MIDQSRIFFQGGGGSSPNGENTALKTLLLVVFLSRLLILQFTEWVQWFYYRENYFSKESEGVQHFPGWGPTFYRGGGGGSKC